MKVFKLEDFPNQLVLFELSSETIEKQIKSYPLEFLQVRNQKVEWELRAPIFLTTFYKVIYNKKEVPRQSVFWEYYLSINKDWFSKENLEQDILTGLKARLLRAYPSLVRDLHFSKYCTECLTDAQVIYNTKLDVEEGIDLLLKIEDIYYGINLFTETPRAYQGRNKKVNRHIPFSNIKYIDIPVNFKSSKQVGQFYLYGSKELEQVKSIIVQ